MNDKKTARINGKNMAYTEAGNGDPILFLHGNPTSSFLWRNIVPSVEHLGRCIAPDLIGMGDSDKLIPPEYRFVDHRRYLDALLETLEIEQDVILVLHDWGSGLGFDWARRHRDTVQGIAYMEAIVQPLSDWSCWPENGVQLFKGFRSPKGEELVLDRNLFIERVLPASILRTLSEDEMDEYRRPFRQPGESRRPTLTWPRQIPIGGEPDDVTSIVADYAAWMSENEIPKLFVNADPGSILIGEQREFCRSWKHQDEITVPGLHFIQEDSANEIGSALREWIERIRS